MINRMILICKKNYIEFDITTKLIDFTINKSYNITEVDDFFITLDDDKNKRCRFIRRSKTTLYIYKYFYTQEETRNILLNELLN